MMTMFDLSADLLAFHDQFVKLGSDAEKRLIETRDTNLQRIRNGLTDLGKPVYKSWRNQGGYAMKTVISDPAGESDHDIDVALIFDKDDLPAGALQARQRVRDALCKRGTNFVQDPEARTNAVTVWYQDGYHLDFAVYRKVTDYFGNVTHQHASTDWVERDPSEVTSWFEQANTDMSPKADLFGNAPKVRSNQLRRIVRLVKWFCRSRPSWSLPGGMITTTLAVECYRPNRDRDDIALYDTLDALQARLQGNCIVWHPSGGARELTAKTEFSNQVQRLRDRLDQNLPKLAVLFESGCTREKARFAWDWVFNHHYWAGKEQLEEAALAKADLSLNGYWVKLACEYAKSEKGKIIGRYRGQALPKNLGLRFSLAGTNVPEPYQLRFDVQNQGDEAKADDQEAWSATATSDNPEWWTSTAYKGTHRMTCSVIKNGITVASASVIVKIVGGLLRRRI